VSASSAVLSVLIPTVSLYPSGNDGDNWVSATILVPSAKTVTMAYLFSNPSQGLNAVADAARTHFLARTPFLATDSCVREAITGQWGDVWLAGLNPTAENYKVFAVTPDGLTIGFSQGQISESACGLQTATICGSQLQPLLSVEGKQLIGRLQ